MRCRMAGSSRCPRRSPCATSATPRASACAAIGEALKDLGQPEAGLLVAAFVARATNGVEKSEADVLKAIGKAAGLTADKVKGVVKRATGLEA